MEVTVVLYWNGEIIKVKKSESSRTPIHAVKFP
jgi:hypothetical protein